jgi:hypothetical protein
VSLSLLLGGIIENGPEGSRARRYWAGRSEPLTPPDRSEMIEEEKAAERFAKTIPPFWYSRPPPPTRLS